MKQRLSVGLDAGCKEHAVVVLTEEGKILLREKIVNDHAGCDQFLKILRRSSEEGY